MKYKNKIPQVLFTIVLMTNSWHICPHPSKKEVNLILEMLDEIKKELKRGD